MTFKNNKIGLIMALMGIGALAAYFVNWYKPCQPSGIILFDLSISVILTMFFGKKLQTVRILPIFQIEDLAFF